MGFICEVSNQPRTLSSILIMDIPWHPLYPASPVVSTSKLWAQAHFNFHIISGCSEQWELSLILLLFYKRGRTLHFLCFISIKVQGAWPGEGLRALGSAGVWPQHVHRAQTLLWIEVEMPVSSGCRKTMDVVRPLAGEVKLHPWNGNQTF